MQKILALLGGLVALIGVIVVAVIVTPLLYAIGGYTFGIVLMIAFPFAGDWVIGGMQAFGLHVTVGQLPVMFAALACVSAYLRSKADVTVKKEK